MKNEEREIQKERKRDKWREIQRERERMRYNVNRRWKKE